MDDSQFLLKRYSEIKKVVHMSLFSKSTLKIRMSIEQKHLQKNVILFLIIHNFILWVISTTLTHHVNKNVNGWKINIEFSKAVFCWKFSWLTDKRLPFTFAVWNDETFFNRKLFTELIKGLIITINLNAIRIN